jgi:hypothetical protein
MSTNSTVRGSKALGIQISANAPGSTLVVTNNSKASSSGIVFGEGAFSESFLQNHVVNYKNVLIRCHKKKVRRLSFSEIITCFENLQKL